MKNIKIEYSTAYPIDNPTKEIIKERCNQVEKLLNLKLPQNYKDFLVEYRGGGRPDLYLFERNHDLEEGKNVHGTDFMSGELPISYIWSSNDILEPRLLNHPALDKLNLFTFAYDIADDPICISLAEKTYGKIYSWLEDQAPPDEDEDDYEDCDYYDNIYYVCNSFNEFIDRLTDSNKVG